MLYFRVLFLCCMRLSLPVLCSCCMLVVKKAEKNDVLYFCAHRTVSGILCYILSARGTRSSNIVLYFPRVEHALALLCYIFCAWNKLWRYCVVFSACVTRSVIIVLYFSMCGTRSGVIVLYFLHVEHALVFCVKFITFCNIPTF